MVYLSGLWAFWGQYNCILISCILGILNTYTVPGFERPDPLSFQPAPPAVQGAVTQASA